MSPYVDCIAKGVATLWSHIPAAMEINFTVTISYWYFETKARFQGISFGQLPNNFIIIPTPLSRAEICK